MGERNGIDGFLLGEFKSGNPRAFDKIFNNHYQNMCRFAYSIVHDEDTAHSLVQQVFVNLWENRESSDHIESLVPFLTTMVRNHCLNFVKREKRNINLAEMPAEAQNNNTTGNEYFFYEFEEQLINALSLLPERCKLAFEMSRFENLTNKEIALKMEITTKGVEALIGRALKSLRISLADYLPSVKNDKMKNPILFFCNYSGSFLIKKCVRQEFPFSS
jgi:RNA polymerase sigma-70 factor (ECF subfamily)